MIAAVTREMHHRSLAKVFVRECRCVTGARQGLGDASGKERRYRMRGSGQLVLFAHDHQCGRSHGRQTSEIENAGLPAQTRGENPEVVERP
jgi:hypothetical protein